MRCLSGVSASVAKRWAVRQEPSQGGFELSAQFGVLRAQGGELGVVVNLEAADVISWRRDHGRIPGGSGWEWVHAGGSGGADLFGEVGTLTVRVPVGTAGQVRG